jgi:Ni/Co efflux regulator RcnB
MRKFVISAAILALLGGTSLAIAQDRGHDGGSRGGGQQMGGRNGGGENKGQRSAPQAQSNSGAMNGRDSIGERQFREHHDAPSPPSGVRDGGRASGSGRPDFNRPGPDRRDARRFDDRRDFNNGRGDRGRRDFSNYRNYHQNFRAAQRFRAPPYRRPPGYFTRRWSWGQTLPAAFWARDYWLTDFYAYDLPPPPYGAIWVRVGEDALLIDQYTGEIIEVDYGVFY